MRTWDSAAISGVCAYDKAHRWKAGTRVFRVQVPGWSKTYCGDCARRVHEAPQDTGQVLDVTDAPAYPAALKPAYELLAEPFEEPRDVRMLAAGKDAD